MDKSMTSTGVRMAGGVTSVIDIKGEVTAASEAVRNGLVGLGRGDGPVDVLHVAAR